MSVNGKRDQFTLGDFIAAGKTAKLPRGRAQTIVLEATDVVSRWPAYAERANVPEKLADAVAADLRLGFAGVETVSLVTPEGDIPARSRGERFRLLVQVR